MRQQLETLLDQWRELGWSVSGTSGGRLKLTHPSVESVVYTGPNPSDIRAVRNLESVVRRAMRVAGILKDEPDHHSDHDSRKKPKKKIKTKSEVPMRLQGASRDVAPDRAKNGFLSLADFAEQARRKQDQARRRQLVEAWRFYVAKMLDSGWTWERIWTSRERFETDPSAQERVLSAHRAASPDDLGIFRARIRSRALMTKEAAARRLAISAALAKFRGTTGAPVTMGFKPHPESASIVIAPHAVSMTAEGDWPEFTRAWRYAVLKMRIGGARWSAIRVNNQRVRKDKLLRQRVLDAYRAANAAEVAALRSKMRAGQGRAKELERHPPPTPPKPIMVVAPPPPRAVEARKPVVAIPVPQVVPPAALPVAQARRGRPPGRVNAKPLAPVAQAPAPTSTVRATVADVREAVANYGKANGITYTPPVAKHECKMCVRKVSCWRVRAGVGSAGCRNFAPSVDAATMARVITALEAPRLVEQPPMAPVDAITAKVVEKAARRRKAVGEDPRISPALAAMLSRAKPTPRVGMREGRETMMEALRRMQAAE